MAVRSRQQTIEKRSPECVVEEKHRLRRELKYAKREAAQDGDLLQPEPADDADQ